MILGRGPGALWMERSTRACHTASCGDGVLGGEAASRSLVRTQRDGRIGRFVGKFGDYIYIHIHIYIYMCIYVYICILCILKYVMIMMYICMALCLFVCLSGCLSNSMIIGSV